MWGVLGFLGAIGLNEGRNLAIFVLAPLAVGVCVVVPIVGWLVYRKRR